MLYDLWRLCFLFAEDPHSAYCQLFMQQYAASNQCWWNDRSLNTCFFFLRNKSSHDILMGYHGDSLTFNVRSKFIFSILSIDGFVSFYLDCMGTDANITSKLQFSRWIMMTSSNGNIFRVTNALCGEFSGHPWIPRTKASGAEFWCFYLSTPEPTVEQTILTPVIWDAIAFIMTSL